MTFMNESKCNRDTCNWSNGFNNWNYPCKTWNKTISIFFLFIVMNAKLVPCYWFRCLLSIHSRVTHKPYNHQVQSEY